MTVTREVGFLGGNLFNSYPHIITGSRTPFMKSFWKRIFRTPNPCCLQNGREENSQRSNPFGDAAKQNYEPRGQTCLALSQRETEENRSSTDERRSVGKTGEKRNTNCSGSDKRDHSGPNRCCILYGGITSEEIIKQFSGNPAKRSLRKRLDEKSPTTGTQTSLVPLLVAELGFVRQSIPIGRN
jgi:hypothetical protein